MSLLNRAALVNQPRRVHVVCAKALGATMWFWMLWRLKHDWSDFVVCNVCKSIFLQYTEAGVKNPACF